MAETRIFAGRRILITGAGSGIGAVTARALVELGARVAILDRDGAAAQRTAEQPDLRWHDFAQAVCAIERIAVQFTSLAP